MITEKFNIKGQLNLSTIRQCKLSNIIKITTRIAQSIQSQSFLALTANPSFRLAT
jgi:hypothetical protein